MYRLMIYSTKINNMEKKTHYRKVFKSDHLGVADLEDYIEEKKRLVFTIKEVKQEIGVQVAGHKGNFNIAYFNEAIKPLVLNAGNSRIVKAFNHNSPFVEDWGGTVVELYIDSGVKMKGEVVGGVRIRQVQPKVEVPELVPGSQKWNDAIDYLHEGNPIANIENKYKLSEENKTLLMEAAI